MQKRPVFESTSEAWIESTFQQCECLQFLATANGSNLCGCGRDQSQHDPSLEWPVGEWKWEQHAIAYPTNCYGTVEFGTGVHAQYLRMSPSARPEDVVQLLTEHWGVDPPRIVVSIHGGMNNFDLPPKVKRAFRRSLQKLAAIPGCWILTSGLNIGISKHVGDALTAGVLRRNRAVVIGITPWGVLAGRQRLAVKNKEVHYYPLQTAPGASILNPNHSYFLLLDDGSVGRYGFELEWRHRFELAVSTGPEIDARIAPLIAVFVEGGTYCIRLACEFLKESKPIVVVGDSGRASQLLSMAMKLLDANPTPELGPSDFIVLKSQIKETFGKSDFKSQLIMEEISFCLQFRPLMETWIASNLHEADLDLCILSSLLKSRNRSAPEQVQLALAWNRVDLVSDSLFGYDQKWPEHALGEMMIEALLNDRLEFVKLFLAHGVVMAEILTAGKLEQLYNLRHSDSFLLRDVIRFVTKDSRKSDFQTRISLADVGLAIELLMGFGYRAPYQNLNESAEKFHFPFSELVVWAVLFQRQEMARLMCIEGEEILAKALVACRLYRSMARYVEPDVAFDVTHQLRSNSHEFSDFALQILEKCSEQDEILTQQLLTYELGNFSGKTALSLAVSCRHKDFLAHKCSQNLLDMLWLGGLQPHSTLPWKIILGLLFPPYAIFGLEYLTLEELSLQPQTEAELEEQKQDDLSSRNSSGTLSPVSSQDGQAVQEQHADEVHRRVSKLHNLAVSRKRSSSIRHSTEHHGEINFAVDLEEAPIPPPPKNRHSRLSIITELAQDSFRSGPGGTRLGLQKRVYEFYNAPVSKFWLHCIGYAVFILCYCYTILTVSHIKHVQWPEWYIIAYVISLFADKFREIASVDAHGIGSRIEIYFMDTWNICDVSAIALFLIGLTMRWHEDTFEACRAFWIFAVVFFLIHVFDIFQANNNLATYIMILRKMLVKMMPFLVILGMVSAICGVAIQASRFPFRKPEWDILKDLFIEPYYYLYGEVYHEFVDTRQCDPDNKYTVDSYKPPCWCCGWLWNVAQAVYCFIANVVMMSLVVSVFNSVYGKVNLISKALIRFQRYRLIVDYQLLPILPPPFVALSHLYLMARALYRFIRGRSNPLRDTGLLKVMLSPEDIAALHDFEEQARDELIEQKEHSRVKMSMEDHTKSAHERIDAIQEAVEQLAEQHKLIRKFMKANECHLAKSPTSPMGDSSGLHLQIDSEPSLTFSRHMAPLLRRQRAVSEDMLDSKRLKTVDETNIVKEV